MNNPFSDLRNSLEAGRKAAEEHEASCTEPYCQQCGRHKCRDCDGTTDNVFAPCKACIARQRDRDWLEPAMESIPAAFKDLTFDAPWLAKLVGAQAMQQAKSSMVATRLAFVGPPGSGKTSLAIAMFRAVLEADKRNGWRSTHRYVSAHALAKARAGHPLGQGEAPLVASALASDLLIIDELGGEDARHASAVAEVIYERHAEDRPTWVTTGVRADEATSRLAERYGGGIARRLFETATTIHLVGRRR